MTIDFDAFNAEIVSASSFGQDVIYTPAAGGAKTIEAVFDNGYLSVQGIGDAGVGASSPAITCLASDVDGAARGDTVTVVDTIYYVTEVHVDGRGLAVLILSEDA